MTSDQGITRELGLGEVVSKTFDLYRRNFVKYFVLFLIIEAIIGVASTFAYDAFPLPALPPTPTSQQVVDWFPGFFSALISLVALIGVASLVFGTIALGGTVRMASDEIENRPVDLGAAVKFAATKLLWMWVLGLLLGIMIGVGIIALIIPGIILAIMFSVAFQALLIENAGIGGSLSRSRELVSHRWLKTFATFLVVLIIIAIASGIVSAISAPFGPASQVVSSALSALYQPILPIAATVYFYSNRARVTPAPTGPTAIPAPGMKFCPNCGTQLEASVTFCSNCGAKQPA